MVADGILCSSQGALQARGFGWVWRALVLCGWLGAGALEWSTEVVPRRCSRPGGTAFFPET